MGNLKENGHSPYNYKFIPDGFESETLDERDLLVAFSKNCAGKPGFVWEVDTPKHGWKTTTPDTVLRQEIERKLIKNRHRSSNPKEREKAYPKTPVPVIAKSSEPASV